MLAYVWERYQTNVVAVERDRHLLTLAWHFLGDKEKPQAIGLDDFPRYKEEPFNDFDLADKAQALLTEADVVCGHNAIEFDIKILQGRMLEHSLAPPSPFQTVDTLKVVRSKFGFTSNKLGDLCRQLDVGVKADTGGIGTWLGCLHGDPKAWTTMKRYNIQDVAITEKLYGMVSPWSPKSGTPNLATLTGERKACPRCASTLGMVVRGYAFTGVTKFVRYQCSACGGYSRSRVGTRMEPNYVPA